MKTIKRTLAVMAGMMLALTATQVCVAQDTEVTGSYNPVTLPVTATYETTDGANNYKVFQVEAEREADYHIGLWLLPARYEDGGYSVFSVIVNGEQRGTVTPSAGNWQYITLDGEDTIPLKEGDNVIAIGTKAPEIPSVECISVAADAEDAVISSGEYDEFLAEAMEGADLAVAEDYTEIESYSTAGYVQPAFLWDMELRYTFYKKVSFTKGEDVFITSNSEKPHIIDIMYCGKYVNYGTGIVYPPIKPTNPTSGSIGVETPNLSIFETAKSEEMQGMNWLAKSQKLTGSNAQVATARIYSIPKTGVYLIRIRTLDNGIQGTADVQIGERYFYENSPISLSYKPIPIPADGVEYASMTKSDNPLADNPMIFIHGNNSDRLVGWNDNGAASKLSEHDLGKYDAYISQVYRVKATGISVSLVLSSKPVSKCDVVARMAVGNGQSSPSMAKAPENGSVASVQTLNAEERFIELPGVAYIGKTIDFNADCVIDELAAYDFSGNCLARLCVGSSSVSVPLSKLNICNKGIYLLSVSSEKGIVSGKLVVR